MRLFVCDWPNGTTTFVCARNEREAALRVDELGDPYHPDCDFRAYGDDESYFWIDCHYVQAEPAEGNFDGIQMRVESGSDEFMDYRSAKLKPEHIVQPEEPTHEAPTHDDVLTLNQHKPETGELE